ncbi:MAG: DUF3179 domain-containing protein [Rhizobiaceae bacterium]
MIAKLKLAALLMALMFALPAMANPGRWVQEGWKTDFSQSLVDFGEILSGGPPRDGIPSIDNPIFANASDVKNIGEQEPVIQLQIGDDIRAYPLQVLTWHEIVNDTVGGSPVAVTYCPLCNASIVFDRRVGDRVFEFGTTGKLRNSDLVMYDRTTDSWWQQFTGEAIVGEMMGEKLKLVPSRIVAFADFKSAHPQAKVLIPNNPGMRDYGRNPYAGYDSASYPFLYRGDMPDGIEPMARVIVVRTSGEPIVVTMEKVRKSAFEQDGYRVEWSGGVNSALDRSRISDSKDVGTVRVTKGGEDIVHDITFAFVAHAFHPDVPIVK